MLLWYIAVGGAIGAVGRYALSGWATALLGTQLPWGTLSVNVLGSFALGLLWKVSEGAISPELRAFLAVGVLGAFTTFSTFSREGAELVLEGDLLRAVGYLLGSVVLGLLAVLFGLYLASLMTGGRG